MKELDECYELILLFHKDVYELGYNNGSVGIVCSNPSVTFVSSWVWRAVMVTITSVEEESGFFVKLLKVSSTLFYTSLLVISFTVSYTVSIVSNSLVSSLFPSWNWSSPSNYLIDVDL